MNWLKKIFNSTTNDFQSFLLSLYFMAMLNIFATSLFYILPSVIPAILVILVGVITLWYIVDSIIEKITKSSKPK